MNPQAFIFDLDGVLTDTAKYHFQAWKSLADELNLKFDRKINELLKGIGREECFSIILKINQADKRYTMKETEHYINKKNNLYKSLIEQLTPGDILEGIPELLIDAKFLNLKLAVASSSKNAPFILDSLELLDSFDYIADASRIANNKPCPDIFLDCANALGIQPELCIGFEDAEAGIAAIKRANMFAVGINAVSGTYQPDMAVRSTKELNLMQIIDKYKTKTK